MIGTASVVCALVFVVRFGWLGLLAMSARKRKNLLQPTSVKEVLILTWCGMRGLATLALALPLTLADATPFPERDQLLVIACAVLLATLVLPGLTLPWLMRVLNASQDGSEERDAARVLARRAQAAAVAALKDNELMKELPAEKVALVKDKMTRFTRSSWTAASGTKVWRKSGGVAASWLSPFRPSHWTPHARKWWPPGMSQLWTPKWRTGSCGSWTCGP